MSSEEDIAAEAFAKEALRLDAEKQEDVEEKTENAGRSSMPSSSDEDRESRELRADAKQDANQSSTSKFQRSQEVLGPLQQARTLPSMYNFMRRDQDERFGSVKYEQDIAVNNRKSIPTEHMFLSPAAMETPRESMGNLKKSVEASNDYSRPTSNLPPKFRSDSSSSSGHQLPEQTRQGSWMTGSSSGNWQPFPQMTPHEASLLGSQELGFQALLNQVIASSKNFPLNDDAPADQFQAGAAANMPIRQGVGSSTKEETGSFQFDVLPSNPYKRKMMNWQDDTPKTTPTELPLLKWDSPAHGSHGQDTSAPTASGSRPKFINNKVYDPSYEDMGLPIDPHLRLFLARRGKEEDRDRDSKRENKDDEEGEESEPKTKARKPS